MPAIEQIDLSDNEIQTYISGIYSGYYNENNLPENIYSAIGKYLDKAITEGYGMQLEHAYGRDWEFIKALRENVYMFAAAKTYQQTKEISSLLIGPDNKVRTSREFNKVASEMFVLWNKTYGETEYSTAIGQAYAAQKWGTMQAQKKVLPNIEYKAISDPCDICLPLNGLIAPIDDPIWLKISPLNHFNCKCILIQLDDEAELTPNDEKQELFSAAQDLIQAVFLSNPGIDKMIFNEAHPYFDVPAKDQKLAENNFNLPIPVVVEPEYKLKSYEEALPVMREYALPAERRAAISDYAATSYRPINNFLRKGHELKYETHKNTISALSDMLEQAPKVQFTTYRGLSFSRKEEYEKFKEEYRAGATVIDKGFMSTGVKIDTAIDFTGYSEYRVLIEVDGKDGVLIEPWAVPREKEVLFNKGTQFKVLSDEVTTSPVGQTFYNLKLKQL